LELELEIARTLDLGTRKLRTEVSIKTLNFGSKALALLGNKIGNSGEILKIQDGGQWPPDSENLGHTRGNPNWEIPLQKINCDTYETYSVQKTYSSHA